MPVIVARQLSRRLATPEGPITILERIDLTINRGETVAVVGVSGAGKSTLLALLAGLDQATAGEVTLAGQPLTPLSEDQRAALRAKLLGFVFQNFQLLPHLTALENVMLPLELAALEAPATEAQRLLHRVGLAERLHHYPAQLSGGEQQRVALARAFAGNPALLLADEPTGNLDTTTGQRVIELLFELNREQGTTLLLVTHDELLARRCRRVLELDGGQLREL